MEQRREARNLIIVLLTIVGIQNVRTITATVDVGTADSDRVTVWPQPVNITTSIYQESTTNPPVSTSIKKTEETLDSSESNVVHRYAQPSDSHEKHIEEADNSGASSDHAIAYSEPDSEHEEARDVPTRPKYIAPGVWAKPPPDKNIPLNFVPSKLHAQVRGTHVVKKVPQRKAIESAETDEEKSNAHRLREIVTNSKVNTVYTEEGYEDSGYDHAGHVRDADFHEGFARKLHDQQKDDHKKKEEHGNLVPDEFKDYEEDYKDHLEESRKLERNSDDEYNLIGYGRSAWEGSEVDPKLVAENGIRNLEVDIEKDAEEAERSSKIYQKTQESRKLHDDEADSSESEESHGESDLKDEENKPAGSEKRRSKNEKASFVSKEAKQSRELEDKKLHERINEKSSIGTETLASPRGFLTNSSSLRASIDQTTSRYVSPITTASPEIDESTTMTYSQIFWNYFKTRQTPSSTESSALVSPAASSRPEERTPIAVATIDGHGPYLLVTQQETTTSSSSTLLADRAEFGASSARAHNRHLLGRSDDVDTESAIIASTTATFTTVQPLQSLSSVNSEDAGYSSSTTSSVSSSTPAVKILNMTKEAFSHITGYMENPFLNPILNNSNIIVTKNKIKYKVLVRPDEPKKAKPVTERSPYQQFPLSYTFKEDDKYKKVRDELNAKYNNIKNRQKSPFLQGKKKIVYPDDLTLLRPPTFQQQNIYPIFSINPSAVDYSNFESDNWKSLLQDQHHPQSVKLRIDPYIRSVPTKLLPPPPRIANIYANNYRRNGKQSDNYPFYIGDKPQQQPDNAFRYLPLAPEASWRTRFRRKRSNDEDEFLERGGGAAANVKAAAANNTVTNDGKSERLDSEGSFSRVTDRPKGKSARRGTIGRLASPARPRADESGTSATLTSKKNNTVATGESENAEDTRETVAGELKAEEKSTLTRSKKRNERKSDTNAEELSQRKRNVSQGGTRSKNGADGKDHEELLNESPKISGDVIDKEIAVRFNEKDDNETSSEIQEKGKIEVDVPDFDYVEELAEDSLVESSTTTEATVDSKKYPFYNDESLPSASALKYIVDPRTVPRKSSRGMEFYNSRNAYRQCDTVEPTLDTVLPEKEEPDPERGPPEDLPRLRGLGDKLDCLKAKYFDENPLDNPLFAEKLVVDPTPPSELDSMDSFTSQILALPKQSDEYVVPRVSKKPERNGRQQWRGNRPRENQESIRVNYKYDPQTGRGRNAYMYSVRNTIPHHPVRRTKNRKSRPRSGSTTTQSPQKKSQTASYQNQVYEDVMGNIRYLATQFHEKTTPSSAAQSLETAGSENTQQIVHITPSPPKEKTTPTQNVTEVDTMTTTTGAKSSEIKGLLPPPKYLTPRQSTYRKHRPPSSLSRVSLLKPPSHLPRIIAHHHTLKINKRSVTNGIANSSESVIDETAAVKSTAQINAVENNTIGRSIEETTKRTDWTPGTTDLEIAENKSSPMTLKVKNKKRERNSTSDESPQRVVYTIRDRIRHSKPKSSMRGFGKFGEDSKMPDEDKRRKEPRYNQFTRKKKPAGDQRSDLAALLNSTDAAEIESATSLIEGGESGPDVYYHPEESATHQMVYRTKKEYREPKTAETISDESAENESTTSSYEVHEDIDEDVSTAISSSSTAKAVQNLREYLESDPPGYAEAFPEEATTTSSKNRAKHKEEDEDPDYPKHATSPWNDDSSEKAEEQVETPIRTEVPRDDDSEEVSSKEDEESNKEQTFFTYGNRPSSAENDRDDEERSEKTSYSPFSKYKSTKKKNDGNEYEESSEERSEDYVFPWHADESDKENRWLRSYKRFEYPWEKRERLAKERQRKQKRANRIRDLIFDDETEEESVRRERPLYPWEQYDVPSKVHVNTRRDVSRRNIDDYEESSTERLPFAKFSSRYSSSGGIKPQKPSTAREISRSIKKFLEEDDESKEKTSGKKNDRSASRRSSSDNEVFREKKRKRKIPQANKNSTSLESNRLKSRESTFDEAEKELAAKHVKTKNFNETESQIKAANQLSSNTNEVPATIGERKKRRRKISRNNSTISLDSAPAESSIESAKKRRRKPQTSTTKSAIAADDLDRSRSIFAPVRTRYSKTDEAAKGSELNLPETSEAENLQVKTSTPKTRTIELRSRVSKEKSVKKTVYPDERDNSDSAKKNVTLAQKEPTQTKSKRRRKINNKQDVNNKNSYNRKLTKEKNEEIKTSILPEKVRDRSRNNPLKNLGINRKDVKEINDASIYDGIINDESDDGHDEFWMPPETYAVSNLLMQNIPSTRVKNDQADERTGGVLRLNENREHNSREEGEGDKERRRSLLQTKFIKDPERRLYYYVDRK